MTLLTTRRKLAFLHISRWLMPLCLIAVSVIVTCCIIFIWDRDSSRPDPVLLTREAALELPLTVTVNVQGRFTERRPWHLSMNSAGQAELTINTVPIKVKRGVLISRDKIQELRVLLLATQFFDLKSSYGEIVSDCAVTTVSITLGGDTKSVNMLYFGDMLRMRERMGDAGRAMKIVRLAAGLVKDSNAVDLTESYDRVIEAALRE